MHMIGTVGREAMLNVDEINRTIRWFLYAPGLDCKCMCAIEASLQKAMDPDDWDDDDDSDEDDDEEDEFFPDDDDDRSDGDEDSDLGDVRYASSPSHR